MEKSIDLAVINKTMNYVVEKYSPHGDKIGWLMIASILVEAWDLYSFAFIVVFINELYHPSVLLLGLAGAGSQAGAVVGSILGGWLTDKVGRRYVFLGTMIMFIIFGFAQAFVPTIEALVVVRIILGIPLGADIVNGYTYIMEYMQSGKREVMGNRWQFMFALGIVLSILMVLFLLSLGINHEYLWRVILGLSGVPAVILFVLRRNLPETVVWLIQRGRFVEAKKVAGEIYGDSLAMLPNADQTMPEVKLSGFLKEIYHDRTRWRGTLFGWVAGFAQGVEFTSFGFYIPMMLILLNFSGIFQTNLITLALYLVGLVAGWCGPQLTPKLGQRRISIIGFSIAGLSLLVVAGAIFTGNLILIPFASATFLWGHYWAASNVMTIPSMVAPVKYRGIASGFSYIFLKVAAFMSIFLFPSLFKAVGEGNATLIAACFSLMGLLAAVFILPELYGYKGNENSSDEGENGILKNAE